MEHQVRRAKAMQAGTAALEDTQLIGLAAAVVALGLLGQMVIILPALLGMVVPELHLVLLVQA
jgi:hypothetical protein